jgi:hypothetical protein
MRSLGNEEVHNVQITKLSQSVNKRYSARIYKLGTEVRKRSKYRSSTMYYCPQLAKSQRTLLLKNILIIKKDYYGQNCTPKNGYYVKNSQYKSPGHRKLTPSNQSQKTQARFDPSLIGVKNRCKYINFYTDLRGGSRMTSTKQCKKSYSLCSIFVSYRINHPCWSRKHISGPVYGVRRHLNRL